MDPLEFTLTCTSTGGPATTVEWWRNRELVQEDSNHKTSQMIVTGFLNGIAYKSFLKVKGRHTGRYHCNVSNAFPSSKQSIRSKLCICSSFSVLYSLPSSGAPTPIKLNATYKSSSSVLLEWTYRRFTGPTTDHRYIVYYESQGGSRSESSFSISPSSVYNNMYMYSLTDLPIGGIHNISLVAILELPSPVEGPITPGLLHNYCMFVIRFHVSLYFSCSNTRSCDSIWCEIWSGWGLTHTDMHSYYSQWSGVVTSSQYPVAGTGHISSSWTCREKCLHQHTECNIGHSEHCIYLYC